MSFVSPFAFTGGRAAAPARDARISRVAAATWRTVASLPARFVLGFIWLYQRTLSPVLPIVLGPGCGCRFSPTCSHYAAVAVREHGVIRGGFLALRRLVKCSPLHPGGFDPVPPRRARPPVCRRAVAPATR